MLSTTHTGQHHSHSKVEQTVFNYRGVLTYGEITHLLDRVEKHIQEHLASKKLKKKLFNVVIEIVQNIYNYLKKPELHRREDVKIRVIEGQECYKIVTGNFLLTSDVPIIKSRLELVNSLSASEIKELYLGILDTGSLSNEGGAGLGLLDLVRRSGEKLSFEFEPVDDKFSFFSLEVSLPID